MSALEEMLPKSCRTKYGVDQGLRREGSIIRDLNYVLDLKNNFCINDRRKKSFGNKKGSKTSKGDGGIDGVNEAKNEQKRKGYSSKFQIVIMSMTNAH